MRIRKLYAESLVVFLIFLTGTGLAARTKRQIVFEDDSESENRLFTANCRTPDRRPGRCIRLTSCPALIQTVSRNRLRHYVCGFEGDEPKVCCPQPRREITTSRPFIRTTVRTTARTTPRPIIRTTVRTTPRTTFRTTQRTTRRPTPRTTIRFDERDSGGSLADTTFRPQMTRPPFLPRSCGVTKYSLTRIVGGQAANQGAWPWMAVVFVRRNNGALIPDCGGALVTNRHVVTAAHCVVTGRRSTPLDPSRVVVRLGSHNLTVKNERGAVDVEVEEIRRHEQFESRTYKNDIAVLKLKRPVTFTENISAVCLPYDSLTNDDLTGKKVFVIGYGTTAFNGNSSDVLLEAGFYVESQEDCNRAFGRELQITNEYLCAGMSDGSKDACQGDSGGPLHGVGKDQAYYLVGIVSFGKQCGQPGYPGVYTRVTEYLDWLRRNLSD